MTDDRTAPEQADGSQPDATGDPAAPQPPAAPGQPVAPEQPTAPQPPAAPQSWPSPVAAQSWPAPSGEPSAAPPSAPATPPAPPQGWPAPGGPPQNATQAATPAWGSPVGSPVPGEPGAPEWAQPGGGQAPSWGTPPAYPYGHPAPAAQFPGQFPGQAGYPPVGVTRTSPSTGRIVGMVVFGVVILLAVLAGIGGVIFAATRGGDDTASGPSDAPSFGVPGPGATGTDPQLPQQPRATTPAPRVPSPTSSAAKAYVTKANQFCRATTDPDLKAISQLQQTDLPGYLRKAAKINRDLDARLRQDVPDDVKGAVAVITKDWDTLSENYEKAADAIKAGDAAAAAQYLGTATAANEQGNDVAKQIGMNDCADAGGIGVPQGGNGTPTPGVTA